MYSTVAGQHGLPLANGTSRQPLPPINYAAHHYAGGKQPPFVQLDPHPPEPTKVSVGSKPPMAELDEDADLPEDVQQIDPKKNTVDDYLCYPFFTLLVSAFVVAIFGFEYYYSGGFIPWSQNPFFGPSLYSLSAMGAKIQKKIYIQHQYTRLLTSLALHAGAIHLVLTLAYHATLLWPMERKYGFLKITPLYFFSAALGNMFGMLFVPALPAVGPGAAFGGLLSLRALEMYVKRRREEHSTWRDWISFVVSLIGLFGAGVLPYIDNFAQLGGMLVGFFLALVLIPELDPSVNKWIVVSIGLGGFAACIGGFIGIFVYNTTPPAWCPYCYYIDCLPLTGFCNSYTT